MSWDTVHAKIKWLNYSPGPGFDFGGVIDRNQQLVRIQHQRRAR